MMQAIGRRYVGTFNARYRRTGTLWEGRYKAALVDSERYVLACYRYIELNPYARRWLAPRATTAGRATTETRVANAKRVSHPTPPISN